jgi:hypothetical protein
VTIELLTPLGALFAFAAVVPIAVYVLRERRLRAVRAALRLEAPSRGARLSLVAALAAVPVLLGLAAAQPVVAESRTLPERTDAQVFVAVDISRSMLARSGPSAETRFERARSIAIALRDQLPEVPMGIASMTQGMLPHLFPTTNRRVFVATLEKTLEVGEVWTGLGGTIASSLDAVGAVPRLNYFPPAAKQRVLVVLTDGESLPLETNLESDFSKEPRVQTILVHIWREGEQVYLGGVPESGYQLDRQSRDKLERIAEAIGGSVVAESDAGALAGRVRSLIGTGETVARPQEGERRALMPYVTLLALVPLGFVLLRRNVYGPDQSGPRSGTR